MSTPGGSFFRWCRSCNDEWVSDERFFDRLYDLDDGDDVRRHYQRFAADYDAELTSRGYAQPDRVADALVAAGVPGDARILDVGCGSGLSGVALAKRGFSQIDGCDYSSEMLARARATDVYRHLYEVDLNAGELAITGSPFDVVTAVGVLGHGHVAGLALRSLALLLESGGWLVFAINELAWPDGDAKPALDQLVEDETIDSYEAQIGEHIPGLGSRGWVVIARAR